MYKAIEVLLYTCAKVNGGGKGGSPGRGGVNMVTDLEILTDCGFDVRLRV